MNNRLLPSETMKSLLLIIVALLATCSEANPKKETVEEPKSSFDVSTTESVTNGQLSLMETDGSVINDLDKPANPNSAVTDDQIEENSPMQQGRGMFDFLDPSKRRGSRMG